MLDGAIRRRRHGQGVRDGGQGGGGVGEGPSQAVSIEDAMIFDRSLVP